MLHFATVSHERTIYSLQTTLHYGITSTGHDIIKLFTVPCRGPEFQHNRTEDMMLFHLLQMLLRAIFARAILLSNMSMLISACPRPEAMVNNKILYGVGNPTIPEPYTINSWPVVPVSGHAGEYEQPVRYCWVAQSDYDSLHALLPGAISKWDVAMHQSRLKIRPDKGVELDEDGRPLRKPEIHLCGPTGVNADALYMKAPISLHMDHSNSARTSTSANKQEGGAPAIKLASITNHKSTAATLRWEKALVSRSL